MKLLSLLWALLRDTHGGGGPSPFVNAFSGPNDGSLRYNTSQFGSPLFLVYGTQRVSVNLLEEFNFSGSGSSGKGGKGLGSSGGKKGGASYTIDVAFGVCQGPATFTGAPVGFSGNNRVWANGGVAGSDRVGLNFYVGTDGQTADPVFESSDPNTPVIAYSGTTYVTGTPMQLGSTPALPNISFEVSGIGSGAWVTAGYSGYGGASPAPSGGGCGPGFPGDANPAFIITDLLTNPRYGAGFPIGNLDVAGSVADYGNYCQAAQLAMSLLLDRLQPCARWIEEICELTVSAPVWSGALLKIVPYGDQALSQNGATWSPNLTWAYSLTDSDFLDWGGDSDPVICTRKDPATMTNWLSLEYMDASNSYNPQILPQWDQALIDQFGVRLEPPVQGHEFTNATSASVSAQLMLQRKAYIRNTYKFKLGFRFSLLEPMDIVLLTDGNLGLAQQPARVIQIEEDDNSELTVTAEEIPGVIGAGGLIAPQGTGTATVYTRLTSAGSMAADMLADPGTVNPPVIFEPPSALTGGAPEVWVVATGESTTYGGCLAYISQDGNTYAPIGTILAGGRQGVLTANLPSHADPDTADTLSVDLSMCAGSMISGTQADADGLVTLCYVDGELIAYETATLTSASHYNLTYLRRGAYGTAIRAHASGSQFARCSPTDPAVLRYAFPASYIGRTLYLKLLAFNTFGLELQTLDEVEPTIFALTGAGAVITPNNQVITNMLDGVTPEDWGTIGTPVIATADFGVISLTPGLDIDLGTV